MNAYHRPIFGAILAATWFATSSFAFTPIQQPPESTAVPGNVMLALSVEFPTGLQVSYTAPRFNSLLKYEGYFDNRKCYTYSIADEVFNPTSAIGATGTCGDSEWNGNLLNWLTMTNLDQFRSVMTGGTRDNFSTMSVSHPGDTTARTVLIRSFSDRNSYNPIKFLRSTDPIPLTLRSPTEKPVRSGGYGSKFLVSDSNNFSDNSANQRDSCASTALPATGVCFNIRVSACVQSPAQGVVGNTREANCQAKYSGVAKPEGLVQEYAATLRFGAFGYLNETGQSRNGGVLRSAMKSVGPVAATATGVVSNPNFEWNTGTGVLVANPDPSDATDSAVSNSGLMNYLNKFGYAAGYKGNDPVSEMYYAALRYMRGYALPTEYTNDLTADRKDGFPVITGADHERGGTRDPMINTCQKNFILGIGDINTHCDGNLPGSDKGLNGTCGKVAPSDPDSLNVQTIWSGVTGYENIADNDWIGGSTHGTPYVAGLAHWANTTDIRDDLSGTQNVKTYWVDVLEAWTGTVAAASLRKTQYWLAAKYGGFDTSLAPSNNPNVKIDPASPLSWDKDGNGVPDNWFAGSTPDSLKKGLSAAFSKINSEAGASSASSAAVTSSRQTSNSEIIYAGYNPKDWTGNVRSCTPSQTAKQCTDTPTWDASNWLNDDSTVVAAANRLTTATRKIFTLRDVTGAGVITPRPFKWSSLSTAQQTLLDVDGNGAGRVEFLRGDRSGEGTLFRTRPKNLFGDVVNSGLTYLAGPSRALVGSKFPGHAVYRNSQRTRPAVVYVGGNDGMLHALSGVNGKELFAYVPNIVLPGINSLSAFNFKHKYFVDSTPMVGDFEKTGSTAAAPSWGTLLVGGLGAGGQGYYALDITEQRTFATDSEATLAEELPIWEFTSNEDVDLGYTFNEPSIHPISGAYQQIAKVADQTEANGVWRVVVGNGYGSTNGKAVLFMLNANTGAASTKLVAYTPSTGSPALNGLSTPTPVDTDRDGLIDTVYAGDSLGNMHKFQFSKPSGLDFVLAKPTPVTLPPTTPDPDRAWRYLGKVYEAAQPITTAPSVIQACDGVGWNLLFGSGKLNEDTDYTDKTARGYYSVVDKSPSSALTVSATDLANISPLTETTFGSGRVGRSWSNPSLSGKRGWKMAFTDGERVLTNSTLPPDTGAVLFATTKPAGDVCTPGNSGFLMAVDICSGKTGGLVVDGIEVGGLAIDSSGIVKVSNTFTNTVGRGTVVCNQDDCKGPDAPTFNPSVAPRGRYNWREILTK